MNTPEDADSSNAQHPLSRQNSATDHTISILQKSLSFRPLLPRESSFWPSAQELLAKHPSFEFLNPSGDSELRKSSPVSAIFNLVATVCGGGVLTLPIAFARAGIIPSTILMVISAIITDFAMYILCSCARRTGGKSYGDVTRIAFGVKAEIGVTLLLFTFLSFVIVAYMVLVKDIWTPLILHWSPALKSWIRERWDIDTDESDLPSNIFLMAFVIVSLPLLLQKNLHALRHTCYVGFTSLILLIVAIVRRSYQLNCVTDIGIFSKNVKWWAKDTNDVVYAFPIISLSFFSIYNVLSVHSALINPTRERVKFVLDGTITICFVLFYIVGLCGYLFAYGETRDNILLNFPLSYEIVSIGRLGYGFTLMFGLPLVFLPCRDALLLIPTLIKNWWLCGDPDVHAEPILPGTPTRKTGITMEGHLIVNGVDFDEERPLLKRHGSSIIPLEQLVGMGSVIPMSRLVSGICNYGATPKHGIVGKKSIGKGDEDNKYSNILAKNEFSGISLPNDKTDKTVASGDISVGHTLENLNFNSIWPPKSESLCGQEMKKIHNPETKEIAREEEEEVETSIMLHVFSTLCILTCAYFCAVAVPGVGVVWSICGSSMSLIIGFFIPAASYLKIRSKKRLNPRSVGAWTMAVFSIVASIICTYHVVRDATDS